MSFVVLELCPGQEICNGSPARPTYRPPADSSILPKTSFVGGVIKILSENSNTGLQCSKRGLGLQLLKWQDLFCVVMRDLFYTCNYNPVI